VRIQSVEGLFKKNMSLRCARTDGNRLVSQEIVRMCLSHAPAIVDYEVNPKAFIWELMKIFTSSFQRLQLIALRSEPRAKVAFTQASIAISSTFFL